MVKEFWDARYSTRDYAYGTKPNSYFKLFIDNHPPGDILLPGEGEGRNAVYAALNGWWVTAVDQSMAGRKKALRLAKKHNIRIEYEVQDLTELRSDNGSFDAVALVFLHLHPDIRTSIHRNLIKLLKPGGWMIIEAFSKDQLGRKTGGPQVPEMLYNEEILSDDFKELELVELYEKLELLNEGPHHQGKAALVRLMAKKSF